MQWINEFLIKELERYPLGVKVMLMDDEEIELDIEFVSYDEEQDTVYIKGYLQ